MIQAHKKAYLKTYGCQMNEHDSLRMRSVLERQGYALTDDISSADLVVLNTCSVREKPEHKVYSFLGTIRELKHQNPDVIIGVAGCVAQQEGRNLLKREKSVDMVFGPDNMFKLPDMIERVQRGQRVLETKWAERDERRVHDFIPEEELERNTVDGCKAYVAISKGCDNFCTFCVVPYTRGRDISRRPEGIMTEVRDVVGKGGREIMLLGQNVNSYRADEWDFYTLLDAVSRVEGLYRLRFKSPHPNDWNDKLSDLLTARASICNQLHLPYQAGSDRVLLEMRRNHTVDEYLAKIDYLRSINPGVGISTDIICGFPSETDAEFEGTLEVMRHVRFEHLYAFKYSERPNTLAARKIEDDVPEEVKSERLQRVLDLHRTISEEQIDAFVGQTVEVLIDSAHPQERGIMCGRTQGDRPVVVRDASLEIGDLVNVQVDARRKFSLEGVPEIEPS
ncbi:MAG: tRNA (N6-isopentenyl adenosine(37)-C2)-methylthiotransferase MiaB [Verrucomicrobia bacterium]|nr:tRNA (N6-isopentenyl adenosine(37)-C2)-methylthiotransferase MiaB [Verrucomicrobiota bacterium]MDA1085450.1 tRNA (N6-isopentenyl adenosine(37)-C2)-methylthiotransferase MiaB [Verrucomicrobiota bacterium]